MEAPPNFRQSSGKRKGGKSRGQPKPALFDDTSVQQGPPEQDYSSYYSSYEGYFSNPDTVVSNDEGHVDSETIIEGNKLTVLEDIRILHPINVNVNYVNVDIVRKTKDDKSDMLSKKNIPYNENQKQEKQKVTQEMVWEAQLQYFKEQTATEIRRRQLMEVKENFYKAATAALEKSEVSDIFKIFNANKEQ